MAEQALIVNGTIENVVLVDTGTAAGAAYIAALPGGITAVDITGITPEPGVGWTTSDGGKTFTAPPAPTPTAAQVAQAQVATLAGSIPGHITQAQTDATTIASITAGSALTAAQVTAMTNHANGWVTLLQSLQALVESMGYPTS